MKTKTYLAEFLGSATLLLSVVGSSFMASDLSNDRAIVLLVNALVTAAALSIIIRLGHKFSGAHFNPAVTLALFIQGKIAFLTSVKYMFAQVIGAFTGVVLANFMFSDSPLKASEISRTGSQQLLGEVIATSGLIYLALTLNIKLAWKLIPLWIFGAYFFTVSTSFANPAVTIARSFTSAPSGIAFESLAGFILVQFFSAAIVGALFRFSKNRAS